jgi:hypothetical protein
VLVSRNRLKRKTRSMSDDLRLSDPWTLKKVEAMLLKMDRERRKGMTDKHYNEVMNRPEMQEALRKEFEKQVNPVSDEFNIEEHKRKVAEKAQREDGGPKKYRHKATNFTKPKKKRR